ncbi:MAG: hypothetical protein ACREX8_06370, partial [Gammaproteobacteria bacterium]
MSARVTVALRVAGVLFCLAAISGSFVLSFGTWLAVGVLAGFGVLAVAMPLCVDGYVMTALTAWLSPVSERLAKVAGRNLYAIGAASVLVQSSYHGVVTWQATHDTARTLIAIGAGAFPPLIATMAVHLAVSIVREAHTLIESASTKEQPSTPVPPGLSNPQTAVAAIPTVPVPRPSLQAVTRPSAATVRPRVTAADVRPLMRL